MGFADDFPEFLVLNHGQVAKGVADVVRGWSRFGGERFVASLAEGGKHAADGIEDIGFSVGDVMEVVPALDVVDQFHGADTGNGCDRVEEGAADPRESGDARGWR